MVNYLVFLGPALAIIIGTGQLISPKIGRRNPLAISLLFCLGCIHFITLIQFQGYFVANPFLMGTQIPLVTLLGPLFYFYFLRILNPAFTLTTKHFAHFIPTVLAPLILAPYLFLSGKEKQTIQLDYLSGHTELWETFPNNLVVLIFISTLIYIVYPLKTIIPLLKHKLLLNNPTIVIALGFIACFSLNIICVITYQFYDIGILKKGVALYFTCWIVAVYLINQKHPEFLTTVTDNIAEAKYKKSQLININTDSILKELHTQMHTERIFLDEELTLPILAEKLSLSTHQLSEILNKHLNTSFKGYIKKHRIEEAKRLLVENPSQKVLTISMEVGFRSNSTFNSSFKKETGLSPVEYRKSNINN